MYGASPLLSSHFFTHVQKLQSSDSSPPPTLSTNPYAECRRYLATAPVSITAMGCHMSKSTKTTDDETTSETTTTARGVSAADKTLGPFNFASGLPDCVSANPECYSVLAELPNFRLVQMKVPPGGQDKPHDHVEHSMYIVNDAKLEITDYDEKGASKNNAHVVEVPAGACPIFPAGAHQVKNVSDKEALILFIEQLPTCKPCGESAGFISPFKVAPECYKVLAENDSYYTGVLEMAPGASDPVHNHKDHLIYVLEGEEVTIFVGGDESNAMQVPLKAGVGIPAPMEAPPFGKHSLKNTGKVPLKLLFFEQKF